MSCFVASLKKCKVLLLLPPAAESITYSLPLLPCRFITDCCCCCGDVLNIQQTHQLVSPMCECHQRRISSLCDFIKGSFSQNVLVLVDQRAGDSTPGRNLNFPLGGKPEQRKYGRAEEQLALRRRSEAFPWLF